MHINEKYYINRQSVNMVAAAVMAFCGVVEGLREMGNGI